MNEHQLAKFVVRIPYSVFRTRLRQGYSRQADDGRRTTENGLTLLEVLVGIFILGMITMSLAQVTWLMTKGVRHIEERATLYHTARVAMQKMRADLSMAFIIEPPKSAAGRDMSPLKTGFIGEANTITLTTLSGRRYLAGEVSADQREVTYSIEKLEERPAIEPFPFNDGAMRLVRREDKTLDSDLSAGGQTLTLIEGLVKLQFAYYDPKEGEFVDSWDSTQRAHEHQLPRAVRITLEFPNPAKPEQGDPISFQTVALLGLGPDPIQW